MSEITFVHRGVSVTYTSEAAEDAEVFGIIIPTFMRVSIDRHCRSLGKETSTGRAGLSILWDGTNTTLQPRFYAE
jgi:hypothetical protein